MERPPDDAGADLETLAEIQRSFASFEKALPLLLNFIAENKEDTPER